MGSLAFKVRGGARLCQPRTFLMLMSANLCQAEKPPVLSWWEGLWLPLAVKRK